MTSDKLRDMDTPMVLGHELDRTTLTPVHRAVVERPFAIGSRVCYTGPSGILGDRGRVEAYDGGYPMVRWNRHSGFLAKEWAPNLMTI